MGYAASTVDTDDAHPAPGLHAAARLGGGHGQRRGDRARREHRSAGGRSARGLRRARQRPGRGPVDPHHAPAGPTASTAFPPRACGASSPWRGRAATTARAFRASWSPAARSPRATSRSGATGRSASGGTSLRSWTGPNFTAFGCGPGSAIDGSRRGVWSTHGSGAGSATPGPEGADPRPAGADHRGGGADRPEQRLRRPGGLGAGRIRRAGVRDRHVVLHGRPGHVRSGATSAGPIPWRSRRARPGCGS